MNKIQLFLGKHTTKLMGAGTFSAADNLLLVSSDECERGSERAVNEGIWLIGDLLTELPLWGCELEQQQWKKTGQDKLKRHQDTSFGNKQAWVQTVTLSLSCEPQSFFFLTYKTKIMQCSERLIGKTQLMYLAMCLTQVRNQYDIISRILCWIEESEASEMIPYCLPCLNKR